MHTFSQLKQWYVSPTLSTFLLKSLLGSVILALFSQISIPMQPVPITGQTLGVTLIGFALGARAATAAVALYILEGVAGLPVFAGGASGLGVLMGATGGYLVGFLPSAWILGYASDRGVLNRPALAFAIALLSALVTFAFGLAWLAKFVPADRLLELGFIPFIPGGVIKALLASVLVVPCYRFFRKF